MPSPTGGTVPQRRFIGIRLWDYVVHEVDISDAVRRPIRMSSAGVLNVIDGLLALFPRACALGGAPPGSTVRIDLSGEAADPRRVAGARMKGTHGVAADIAEEEATLHLRASPAAFLRVATGRDGGRRCRCRRSGHRDRRPAPGGGGARADQRDPLILATDAWRGSTSWALGVRGRRPGSLRVRAVGDATTGSPSATGWRASSPMARVR